MQRIIETEPDHRNRTYKCQYCHRYFYYAYDGDIHICGFKEKTQPLPNSGYVDAKGRFYK